MEDEDDMKGNLPNQEAGSVRSRYGRVLRVKAMFSPHSNRRKGVSNVHKEVTCSKAKKAYEPKNSRPKQKPQLTNVSRLLPTKQSNKQVSKRRKRKSFKWEHVKRRRSVPADTSTSEPKCALELVPMTCRLSMAEGDLEGVIEKKEGISEGESERLYEKKEGESERLDEKKEGVSE